MPSSARVASSGGETDLDTTDDALLVSARKAVAVSDSLVHDIELTRVQHGEESDEYQAALDAALAETHLMAIAARMILDPSGWTHHLQDLVATASTLMGDPRAVNDLRAAREAGFLTPEQHADVLVGLADLGWPTT